MKKLIAISGLTLTIGFLLRKEVLTINIHDTYYLISYSLIAIALVLLINITSLVLYFKRRGR